MSGFKPAPHPRIVNEMPEIYLSMGYTAENVAAQYGVSREEQDAFALASHRKAAAAQAAGKFEEEIVPLQVTTVQIDEHNRRKEQQLTFAHDEGVRTDTSLAALAALKPSFKVGGTVTAGNTSQMSDGAAAVLLMSKERAQACGLKPLATFRSYALAGVAPEIMGIGPIEAVPKALRMAGIRAEDVKLYEINEAFAAQCVPIIRTLEIDEQKVNVNGGAIALGHPLGCTGTKMTVTLLHELRRRGGGFGVVTMCIGGGMGAAGVFEVYA
jgi:acetyl-CoA acyltransferase